MQCPVVRRGKEERHKALAGREHSRKVMLGAPSFSLLPSYVWLFILNQLSDPKSPSHLHSSLNLKTLNSNTNSPEALVPELGIPISHGRCWLQLEACCQETSQPLPNNRGEVHKYMLCRGSAAANPIKSCYSRLTAY